MGLWPSEQLHSGDTGLSQAVPHGFSEQCPPAVPCQPFASSLPTVYFWLLFPGLVAMHAACGRSSSEYRPHFDCSASWKMMIIIFDRKEGRGKEISGLSNLLCHKEDLARAF